MKLDWSLYKQRCGEVNVRAFSQYMQTLVRAVTDVTLNYDQRQQTQPQQRMTKESRSKDRHFCGAHAIEDSSEASQSLEALAVTARTPSPACLICKSPEHRVRYCPEFVKKTVDER